MEHEEEAPPTEPSPLDYVQLRRSLERVGQRTHASLDAAGWMELAVELENAAFFCRKRAGEKLARETGDNLATWPSER